MAVPCPGCGREYDVALFEFGRTLWCTCGTRVGLEPRVRRVDPDAERTFAADAMLGRLARWLRLLGFDCAYDAAASDADIVRLAWDERRTLLTRDQRLPEEWWLSDIYLVRSEGARAQLAEVVEHFQLAGAVRVLTRCSHCNGRLRPLARDAAAGRVPPRVLEIRDAFAECPDCGRVYWEGTHAGRIRAVAAALGEPA